MAEVKQLAGEATGPLKGVRILDLTRAFADIYDRAIDVQILRLRRKIEFRPERPALLKTVRGAGYVFEVDSVQEL